MNAYRVVRSTRRDAWLGAAAMGLVLASASLPWWGRPIWMYSAVELACYAVFAMMWNLLAGYGGLVSIGQQAYFGIGGYVTVALANLAGVNPFVSIFLGAIAAAAAALVLSRVAFRLQGGYFAIGTWVLAEVLRLTVANMPAVGGGSGTSLTALAGFDRTTRQDLTFWIALFGVVAGAALTYLFLRSKQGLALQAIRDNETAARSQGVAVARMKLAVYLLAGAGAGFAGGLFFVSNLRISPDAAFSVNWSAYAIFMVMIGGIGSIEGPLLGVIVFWALSKFFSDYGTWYLLGLGLLAIVSTRWLPRGIWGYLQRRWGWSLFPTSRRLIPIDTPAHDPVMERTT